MKVLEINDDTGDIEFEISKEEETVLLEISKKTGKTIEQILTETIDNYINKDDEMKDDEVKEEE